MQIKEPCIIDGSHWNTVNWDALDSRVVAVIWKATQGKYYTDPTCPDFWRGAKGLPRSVYHFFDYNDASAQVANFLTYCEDVGVIVSGKWVAEIEPILDAECIPPSAATIMAPRLPSKKQLDLDYPERFLARNPRAVTRRTNMILATSQLGAQYKAWLDAVEAELKIRPIIYTSKWFWDYTGNPAWAKDYKLFDAQYPINPDGQNHGKYLPYGGWTTEWMWQYAEGSLPGVVTEIDLDVFNGTREEFDAEYGGGNPPPPNPGGSMVTIMTVKSSVLNVRSTPDLTSTTNIIGPQFLKQGDMLWGVEKLNGCVRFTKARRAGADLTLPGPVCWCSMGTNYVWQGWDMEEGAGGTVSATLSVNGTVVHQKDIPAGSTVVLEWTD